MRELRPSLQELKEESDLVGCEVGVEKGQHAEAILTELDIQRLYLVDSFGSDDRQGPGHYERDKGRQLREEAHRRLKDYDEVVWLEKCSQNVTEDDIPARSLDFVYIDGGHSYETVNSDWENVQKIMHPKTIVVFDDYKSIEGVTRVVSEISESELYDVSFYSVRNLKPGTRKKKHAIIIQN